MNDVGDSEMTMHCCIAWGQVKKRDVNDHDARSAWIMYGYR